MTIVIPGAQHGRGSSLRTEAGIETQDTDEGCAGSMGIQCQGHLRACSRREGR